jgi:hypothetical protein
MHARLEALMDGAGVPGVRRPRRRRAALAVTLLGSATLVASGAVLTTVATADTKVAVVSDSVVVSGQPAGPTTVDVTRPDALTGTPVVIGRYSGIADGLLPFTVNTTAATPFAPADCWQRGALASAVTPDIQPGDTVKVTTAPDGQLGSVPAVTSAVVPAAKSDSAGGPIPDCKTVAPFAQNAVTSPPAGIAGGPLALSGVAQPMATGISLSAADGSRSTTPVGAAPGDGGAWSATIPDAEVAKLADGDLTVRPVFAVPDVSTGAPAHIAGPLVSIRKAFPAIAAGAPQTPAVAGGAPAGAGRTPTDARRGPGAGVPGARPWVVSAMRAPASVSLTSARRRGLGGSFVVPPGAGVVRVQLQRGGRTVSDRVVPAGRPGARQTVSLSDGPLRRALRPGPYTLVVTPGASRTHLGIPVRSVVRVR